MANCHREGVRRKGSMGPVVVHDACLPCCTPARAAVTLPWTSVGPQDGACCPGIGECASSAMTTVCPGTETLREGISRRGRHQEPYRVAPVRSGDPAFELRVHGASSSSRRAFRPGYRGRSPQPPEGPTEPVPGGRSGGVEPSGRTSASAPRWKSTARTSRRWR